jgi:flavin reductase (DIM6/NTAB) family NADH-FMN oxidoreductase RutF
LLDDCATALDCRVEVVHDLNGEKLIVGRVVTVEHLKETYEPLVYREEDYWRVVIPKVLREKYGIETGTQVRVVDCGNVLVPISLPSDLQGRSMGC